MRETYDSLGESILLRLQIEVSFVENIIIERSARLRYRSLAEAKTLESGDESLESHYE